MPIKEATGLQTMPRQIIDKTLPLTQTTTELTGDITLKTTDVSIVLLIEETTAITELETGIDQIQGTIDLETRTHKEITTTDLVIGLMDTTGLIIEATAETM